MTERNMEDEIEQLIEQKTGTQAKDPRIKFVSTRNKKAANAIGKKKKHDRKNNANTDSGHDVSFLRYK